MPAELVVFGDTPFASLAWHCLREAGRRVAAFTVNEAYLGAARSREGLPVVAFERLDERYPPQGFELVLALGPREINGLRSRCFAEGKRRGYRFASYRSPSASVAGNAQLGEGCLVFEQAILQPFCRLGDNVLVRSGAIVSHHCEVAPHAFIASQAAIGGEAQVGERAFIGIGAVLRDRIRVAARTLVGAGAVVVADIEEPDGVYVGNPARRAASDAHTVSSR